LSSAREIEKRLQRDSWQLAVAAEKWIEISGVDSCQLGFRALTRGPERGKLEAVTRKRLTKTQQAGKGVAGAVAICDVWRLAIAL
jgi:hypothetical protein